MSDRKTGDAPQAPAFAPLPSPATPLSPLALPRARRPQCVFAIEGEIGAGKTELIGALAARLRARGHTVCTVLEPVDAWKRAGILGAFYADPARYGYTFQTYVFATRILAIAAAFQRQPDADVVLLERSPLTDVVFMELQREKLTPMEMELYRAWCEAWRGFSPLDCARMRIVHLRTALGVCMRRVAARGRAEERVQPDAATGAAADATTGAAADATTGGTAGAATGGTAGAAAEVGGVTLAYQTRLRAAHEAFFCGRGREAFPHMPPSPVVAPVIAVEPELADGNFRDAGPERDRIVTEILAKMGYA